jgi:hypothetical protein
MGTQGVHYKQYSILFYSIHLTGVLPWMVRWAQPAGTRDFFRALAGQAGQVQNILFLIGTIFFRFVPNAQQDGQAAIAMCLVP